MSADDHDIEDDGLGAFRAAWRSMPDEEPPQRGLAELMAAARVKAETMATPSMWERFVAMMRRPQVLALATIMILIGGAVFISTRRDKLEARDEASVATTQSNAGSAAPAGADSHGTAERKETAFDLETAPTEKAAVVVAAPEAKLEAAQHAEQTKPLSKQPPRPPQKKAKGASSDDAQLSLEDELTDRGKGKDSGASGAPRPDPTPPKSADPTVGGATITTGTAEEQGAPKADTNKVAEPTVKQVHAQAKAAAAKNDCERVRVLAKQIARRDAPYYRANIATDKSLATCLN